MIKYLYTIHDIYHLKTNKDEQVKKKLINCFSWISVNLLCVQPDTLGKQTICKREQRSVYPFLERNNCSALDKCANSQSISETGKQIIP